MEVGWRMRMTDALNDLHTRETTERERDVKSLRGYLRETEASLHWAVQRRTVHIAFRGWRYCAKAERTNHLLRLHLQDLQMALEKDAARDGTRQGGSRLAVRGAFDGKSFEDLALWLRQRAGTLTAAFHMCDLNKNGQVCAVGLETGVKVLGGTKVQLQPFWRMIDTNGEGFVTKPQWLHTFLLAEFVRFGIGAA